MTGEIGTPNDSNDGLPSRGTILCVFGENRTVEAYEPSLSACGFTLTRARHGMHGYWLAITARPDVIVTDLVKPDDESSYLLNCLQRNSKTNAVPVVAIVDQLEQQEPALSCLHSVSHCFLNGTDPSEMISALDGLISERPIPEPVQQPDHVSRFDAFFADLGHTTPKAHWTTMPASESPTVATAYEKLIQEKLQNSGVDAAHSPIKGRRRRYDKNRSPAERLGAATRSDNR